MNREFFEEEYRFSGRTRSLFRTGYKKIVRGITNYFSMQIFREMLKLVSEEKVDYAMLPVENSLAGTVIPAYDALIKANYLFMQKSCLELSTV